MTASTLIRNCSLISEKFSGVTLDLLQCKPSFLEKKGTKHVEKAGKEDKHQIMAVFACTMSGKFLPMQLIYKGTTQKCLPKGVNLPSDWDVTFTSNHWANESTTISLLENVIVLYVKLERKALKLQDDRCVLDVLKGLIVLKITIFFCDHS